VPVAAKQVAALSLECQRTNGELVGYPEYDVRMFLLVQEFADSILFLVSVTSNYSVSINIASAQSASCRWWTTRGSASCVTSQGAKSPIYDCHMFRRQYHILAPCREAEFQQQKLNKTSNCCIAKYEIFHTLSCRSRKLLHRKIRRFGIIQD